MLDDLRNQLNKSGKSFPELKISRVASAYVTSMQFVFCCMQVGANGILGLGRKFRIMDDDSNGSLDMAEFSKAMRECELVDLSKKAIEHLFRYLDADDSGEFS